ncbi:MAG: cache domain-containing protein [Tepidibacter sp.]|jgi:hypothetical protein|uniref:cache domain-containing protein n=1 Tax=Tepidibacter sp. TaxID=2529387 RepID=UPI0025F3E70C|nr:cache domain-containing protein [Tepidibacter sp.]MCT4508428.1 cache domain-containing protein [Tepidibacter sp.]
MSKKVTKYTNIILLLLISILPTIIICIWFFHVDKETTVDLTVTSLYTVGKEQEKEIELWFDKIIYDMNFLKEIDCVKNFEQEKLDSIIEYTKLNRDIYKEIIILDKEANIVYGYNYNNQNFKDKKGVKEALAGNIHVSDVMFISNDTFIEAVFPIYNNNLVVGVIYSKINASSLNEIMEFSRLMDESTESYIVDEEGRFITNSRFIPDAVGKKEIDIKNIKLNIDYSNKVPYIDYRGVLVYGIYFDLPYNNWTLIIEEGADSVNKNNSKIIRMGEMLSALEVILVGIFQMVLRNKSKIIKNEDSED